MPDYAGFPILLTADGSPTLCPPGSEPMHNRNGAWGESAHVFLPAVDWVLAGNRPLQFMVVGVGLAYLEFMILCATMGKAQILSFESEPALQKGPVEWAQRTNHHAIYDKVAGLVAPHWGISMDTLRSWVADAHSSGRWRVSGALTLKHPLNFAVSAILYDPYCSKSSPDLWEEAFLNHLLQHACLPECVFASYAKTGNLKRALKAQGFQLLPHLGFKGKRESTFAVRDRSSK